MTGAFLIDTREQDLHILRDLERRGVKCIRKKLNYGDYSFEADGISYERQIVIERKGSIDELIGNITHDKARFEREFKRAAGCKVYLLLEATQEQIDSGQYRSKMKPSDFRRRLATWCHTFQLTLVVTPRSESCDAMLRIFREYIKTRRVQ